MAADAPTCEAWVTTRPFRNPCGVAELPRPVRSSSGVYSHPWPYKQPGFTGVLKWRLCGDTKAPKFPTPEEAQRLLPSVDSISPLVYRYDDSTKISPAGTDPLTVTWTGHASFLVQHNGLTILTDPVFSERCAPVQFAGPKRMVPAPIPVAKLPRRVDIVTISHNHYDHLDTATVKELIELHNPYFVVPLGMKTRWFDSCNFVREKSRIIELDWWQEVELVIGGGSGACDDKLREPASPEALARAVRIVFVPAQHWSMRSGLGDRNKELWGGLVYEFLEGRGGHDAAVTHRCFHSGDTGYRSDLFKTIGAAFGNRFDLAMLPIGAYSPRWFMAPQHVDPAEAVQMHLDIGSRFSVGMHWGTFILTDEPIDEPPKLLDKALADNGLPPSAFVAMKHGETIVVRGE